MSKIHNGLEGSKLVPPGSRNRRCPNASTPAQVLLLLLALAAIPLANAARNIDLIIFSQTLTLEGDCLFFIEADSYGSFLCDASTSPHALSFLTAKGAEREFANPSIKLEVIARDLTSIVARKSRLIGDYRHYFVKGYDRVAQKHLFNYMLCENEFCLTIVSFDFSTVEKILLPLTEELIANE